MSQTTTQVVIDNVEIINLRCEVILQKRKIEN